MKTGARWLLLTLALQVLPAFAQAVPDESVFVGVPFVRNVAVTHQPEMTFPMEAQRRNQGGRMVVAVLVGPDGVPQRHRILEADPPLVFDTMVRDALPDFRFSLASRNGKPIAYETRLTLTLAPR
jgi:TonB family protein